MPGQVAVTARLLQGCSGAGTRGDDVPPLFSTGGTRPPLPHFFGLKFVQKLVHCCNWLLIETQCKIISVHHVGLCRPKLFKNICISLVPGVPHFFFMTAPLVCCTAAAAAAAEVDDAVCR